MQETVLKRVKRFMEENGIKCEEAIYQTDGVIENAYEFIEDLFLLIKEEE
ncbi:hypothetical protein NSQ30_10340 [Bacillus sp. FSL R7-0651]